MKLATIELIIGGLFAGSIVLSTVHPWGDLRAGISKEAPIFESGNVPDNVQRILETKCGDCHSERTKYPLYSHLAPVSWMIEHDVHEARQNLNISRWQSYTVEDRINRLTRIAAEVHTGQMPPRSYLLLHPDAKLSSDEQQLIYDWARAERKQLRRELVPSSDKSSTELKTPQP